MNSRITRSRFGRMVLMLGLIAASTAVLAMVGCVSSGGHRTMPSRQSAPTAQTLELPQRGAESTLLRREKSVAPSTRPARTVCSDRSAETEGVRR